MSHPIEKVTEFIKEYCPNAVFRKKLLSKSEIDCYECENNQSYYSDSDSDDERIDDPESFYHYKHPSSNSIEFDIYQRYHRHEWSYGRSEEWWTESPNMKTGTTLNIGRNTLIEQAKMDGRIKPSEDNWFLGLDNKGLGEKDIEITFSKKKQKWFVISHCEKVWINYVMRFDKGKQLTFGQEHELKVGDTIKFGYRYYIYGSRVFGNTIRITSINTPQWTRWDTLRPFLITAHRIDHVIFNSNDIIKYISSFL